MTAHLNHAAKASSFHPPSTLNPPRLRYQISPCLRSTAFYPPALNPSTSWKLQCPRLIMEEHCTTRFRSPPPFLMHPVVFFCPLSLTHIPSIPFLFFFSPLSPLLVAWQHIARGCLTRGLARGHSCWRYRSMGESENAVAQWRRGRG